MPQYMMLIYTPAEGGPTPEQLQADTPRWNAYTESLSAAGVMVAGDALEGVETATTVSERNSETVLTDGPFAETKEVLAGYYLIDVPDLDAALKWAAKIPAASYGSIEVRPVRVYPQA